MEEDMALCPRCHALLPEKVETCPNCGQSTKVAGSLAVPAPRPAGSLAIGAYLKTGWALFKQYPGGFLGFSLIYAAITLVLGAVPLMGWLVASAISLPLLMGNFIVSAKLMQGHPAVFSDFFTGFNFFLPLMLVAVISSILVSLGLLLLIIPGVYLAVAFLFTGNLVIDRCLDFWPAMNLSRRTVHPMWFGIFAFFLLLLLINLAGALCLGLGLLVTEPLTFCALTAAYSDIFGFQSDYAEKLPRLKQL
jgi:hypothetical protein